MSKQTQRNIWWGVLVIFFVTTNIATWHWWAFLSIPLTILAGFYFAWLIKD